MSQLGPDHREALAILGILCPGDVGELLDIGGQVTPGGDACLPQLVGIRDLAVPPQVDGVPDASLYRTAATTSGRISRLGRPAMQR